MSQLLVQQYLNDLSDLRRASGTTRESVVSEAFKDLLQGYGRSNDLNFIPQYELPKQNRAGLMARSFTIFAFLSAIGKPRTRKTISTEEIAAKFRRRYPRDNIIFEDSKTAVLIQHGNEVVRCPVDDTDKLPKLLDLFFNGDRLIT